MSEKSQEDAARLQDIRNEFQTRKPTQKELLASGDYDEFVPHGQFMESQRILFDLKKERERQKLSLSDLAERIGIDKAALSRLETGKHSNPTLATIAKYAAGLGKTIRMRLADIKPGVKK